MYLCAFSNFSYSHSLRLAFQNLYSFITCLLDCWSLLNIFLSLETPGLSSPPSHISTRHLPVMQTPIPFIIASAAPSTHSLPPVVLHRNMAGVLCLLYLILLSTLQPVLTQHGKRLVEVSIPSILELDSEIICVSQTWYLPGNIRQKEHKEWKFQCINTTYHHS